MTSPWISNHSNQPGLHSPSRPGSASALQRCGSARDTPRSTPRRCVVGFSVADRATQLGRPYKFLGKSSSNHVRFYFFGTFPAFFLKSASKFVFFGFILDFGGWKVVHNLRKWEIRPTAMRSEVRSHKIGKRNWSEAVGIEATKGIIDLLNQKLAVNQTCFRYLPIIHPQLSASFFKDLHPVSSDVALLYLDLHDTWDFNRHRCTWNAIFRGSFFLGCFPSKLWDVSTDFPGLNHQSHQSFFTEGSFVLHHVLGNLKSPVNIRNQCRLFRLNPHQIAGWWNRFRTDCWCRFSIFVSPAQNEVCMKMGHTKSSGTQILYCFYILWNIAWYPIVPPISIFSWETMG